MRMAASSPAVLDNQQRRTGRWRPAPSTGTWATPRPRAAESRPGRSSGRRTVPGPSLQQMRNKLPRPSAVCGEYHYASTVENPRSPVPTRSRRAHINPPETAGPAWKLPSTASAGQPGRSSVANLAVSAARDGHLRLRLRIQASRGWKLRLISTSPSVVRQLLMLLTAASAPIDGGSVWFGPRAEVAAAVPWGFSKHRYAATNAGYKALRESDRN